MKIFYYSDDCLTHPGQVTENKLAYRAAIADYSNQNWLNYDRVYLECTPDAFNALKPFLGVAFAALAGTQSDDTMYPLFVYSNPGRIENSTIKELEVEISFCDMYADRQYAQKRLDYLLDVLVRADKKLLLTR